MIYPYQIGIIVLAADSITINALAVEQDSMPRNCLRTRSNSVASFCG